MPGVRIDPHRYGRLADPAANRFSPEQQFLRLQRTENPRNVAFGESPVARVVPAFVSTPCCRIRCRTRRSLNPRTVIWFDLRRGLCRSRSSLSSLCIFLKFHDVFISARRFIATASGCDPRVSFPTGQARSCLLIYSKFFYISLELLFYAFSECQSAGRSDQRCDNRN